MKKIDQLRKAFENTKISVEELITKKIKKQGYIAIYSGDFDNTSIVVDGEHSEVEAIEYSSDVEEVNVITTNGNVTLKELYLGDLFTIYDLIEEWEDK